MVTKGSSGARGLAARSTWRGDSEVLKNGVAEENDDVELYEISIDVVIVIGIDIAIATERQTRGDGGERSQFP